MTGNSEVMRYSVPTLLLTIVFLLGGCGTNISKSSSFSTTLSESGSNISSASLFVVIEQSEPAFVVFTGIPKALDEKKLEEIKQMVSSKETATMVSWKAFLASVDEYARTAILRNDYPDIRTVDGIVCLVASQQGTGAPWGLTWNGGIALTYDDYQHARKRYESYKSDPGVYEAIRDPRGDPVHPGRHLSFAGCG